MYTNYQNCNGDDCTKATDEAAVMIVVDTSALGTK